MLAPGVPSIHALSEPPAPVVQTQMWSWEEEGVEEEEEEGREEGGEEGGGL